MKSSGRILVVDDMRTNRELMRKLLECLGHEPILAQDGAQALARLSSGIDLMLLDVAMPGMDGYEVARRVRAGSNCRDVPIIMVTSLSSQEHRLRAVEAGANDFIAKPVDPTELRVRIASLLKMKRAQDAVKRHEAELEAEVERRTLELKQALERVAASERKAHEAQLDTIRRLALAAEYRDKDTSAHIQRVSHYCVLLGERLRLSPEELKVLEYASNMHDVGKIGIPDAVLLSTQKLTVEERQIMEFHTLLGARILHNSTSPLLQMGEVIALAHHEKWDGSGYPHGLAGEEIPLYARICAIADVFDALTTKRPYKDAFSNEEAIRIMREGRGKHFDPQLLDLFLDSMDEIESIQKMYSLRS
jgi:putative two-component system response regulator